MNKKKIDELIPKAYDIIREIKILENDAIPSGYKGQIASFGAAVSMGSLLSAICFFQEKGECKVDRSKLIKAINKLVYSNDDTLYENVKNESSYIIAKEKVLNAAIALKLAMNLYKYKDKNTEESQNEGGAVSVSQS